MPTYPNDIHTAIKLVEILREVDAEMPLQTAHALLCIALRPGLTHQQLAEMIRLSQSACSRNVQALSEWRGAGKEGYNLIEAVEDPVDTRRKIMFLKPEGRKIMAKIIGCVRGHEPVEDFKSPTAREGISAIRRSGSR